MKNSDDIDQKVLSTFRDQLVSGVHSIPPPFRVRLPSQDKGTYLANMEPGLYLSSWGSASGGPGIFCRDPYLLPPKVAREIAAALNPYVKIEQRCIRPDEKSDWPSSLVEWVDLFYVLLEYEIDEAIERTREEHRELRRSRADLRDYLDELEDELS